jgi:hypothetical protein
MEWCWLLTHRGGCGILRWVDRIWTALVLGDAGVRVLELGWHMREGMHNVDSQQWDNAAREERGDAKAET